MEDIIFALNAVLPIILTIAVGYLLKKIRLLDDSTSKKLNTLVFKVFLPVMLFLNVYKIESFEAIDFSYIAYAIGITILLFLIGIPIIHMTFKDNRQRGVMLQCIFRANYALVGIPLAQSLFGDEGGIMASLLSAFIVPTFNILAVICLSAHSSENKKLSVKSILVGIAKNPLILGIGAGFVALILRSIFSRFGISLRLSEITPIYKTLQNLSSIATPLALIVLGARFELSAIPTLKKQIVTGTLIRVLIVPFLGLGGALLIGKFSGAQFASLVAVFCTPVAVSSVPMAQEMGADADLAGQLVVWTTIFSSIEIFAASYILRVIGIF